MDAKTKCLICNKEYGSYKSLSQHIAFGHKIKVNDYFDEYLKGDTEGICSLDDCNNPTKFMGISTGYSKCCCNSHAQLYSGKTKEWLLNRSDEDKESWRTKLRDTWKDKSKEERLLIHQKRLKYFKENNIEIPNIQRCSEKKYGYKNISQVPEFNKKIRDTWNNKSKEEKQEITRKSQETCFKNHGVYNIFQIPSRRAEIHAISRKIMEEKGYWTPEHLIDKFHKYRNRVHHLTRMTFNRYFDEDVRSKIGKCGIEGALQIDHKFSIREGFKNNIPPEIISSIVNLDLISWQENINKKQNCSMSKEELLNRYYDYLDDMEKKMDRDKEKDS